MTCRKTKGVLLKIYGYEKLFGILHVRKSIEGVLLQIYGCPSIHFH